MSSEYKRAKLSAFSKKWSALLIKLTDCAVEHGVSRVQLAASISYSEGWWNNMLCDEYNRGACICGSGIVWEHCPNQNDPEYACS